MAIYKNCDELPFTLSIQFSKKYLFHLSREINNILPNNKISNHISLKYLGYERNLTQKQLQLILKKTQPIIRTYKKQPLIIGQFKIFKTNNYFFDNLLYLSVQPHDYICNLHYKLTNSLKDYIDIFESNDLENYTPHISCGKIENNFILNKLNAALIKKDILIDEWHVVLHTSKKEYDIML